MSTEFQHKNITLPPILSVFLTSLRDIGYSLETSVADIIDNCISARAKNISLYSLPSQKKLVILDDGEGMQQSDLIEAMRLGTRKDIRELSDLGRFGLGLKTASFSQCKRLIVFSKYHDEITGVMWDLDKLAVKNDWILDFVDYNTKYDELNLLHQNITKEFDQYHSGTIVLWENIDRYSEEDFEERLDKTNKHISLVFHRYLSGNGFENQKITISFNGKKISSFDPFLPKEKNVARATQNQLPHDYEVKGHRIKITEHILPPLTKLSPEEYKELGTTEGFTGSQGFYLYRQGRLLIYGTWFGLSYIKDASNLVRIAIDIDNTQDELWNIDVKKSTASPIPEIKNILRHYVNIPIEKSKKVHLVSGIKAESEGVAYWSETHINTLTRFSINFSHPELKEIVYGMSAEKRMKLRKYLRNLLETLPKLRIHSLMTANPADIIVEASIQDTVEHDILDLEELGKSNEEIKNFLRADKKYKQRWNEVSEVLNGKK